VRCKISWREIFIDPHNYPDHAGLLGSDDLVVLSYELPWTTNWLFGHEPQFA
jgi:hypothetical protein